MRRRIYMPEEVKQSIREHFATAIKSALEGYSSAVEDEDTMTGHLCAKLRVGMRRVMVSEAQISGEWRWSINYYKFRGRGVGAMEKYLGADGIFELKLTSGARIDSKSLLFQAKMEREGGAGLLKQCTKLSTWREASFVANYAEAGFQAIPLDVVIGRRGGAGSFTNARPLEEYLGREFLDCFVGDDELRYDSQSRRLIWRAMNGEIVATRFKLKHRVRVRVQAPRTGDTIPGVDQEISPEQIHDYRMAATAEEILGLVSGGEVSALKEAQRRLAASYHPDRFTNLDELSQKIMTRRMQEVNDAIDQLRPKRKKL